MRQTAQRSLAQEQLTVSSCVLSTNYAMDIGNLPPLLREKKELWALGIEGSANKVGVGIVHYRCRTDAARMSSRCTAVI